MPNSSNGAVAISSPRPNYKLQNTLLLLVAVWPKLRPLLQQVQLGFAAIDLREARELSMLNPRYAGLDRYNRPYVITAAVGRQVPDRNDSPHRA